MEGYEVENIAKLLQKNWVPLPLMTVLLCNTSMFLYQPTAFFI